MAKPNSVNSNYVSSVLLLMTLCLTTLISSTVKAQLVSDFYSTSCPNAESTITTAVNSAFNNRGASAPGVLRLHFHDCFVTGCDGSILIDSPSEKDAVPNQTLEGFEVVDAAKTAVEKICPGVVSCADILALASQLGVQQMSGGRITWKVPTGRRDGLSSTSASTNGKLPTPNDSVSQLKSVFAGVGLSTDQMVTLSGAHSVGVAHCSAFQGRLGTPPDSTLDSTYAAVLQASCPGGASGTSTNTVNLDLTTPSILDEVYYKNLQVKKGLLRSDENLQNDAETQPIVAANTDFGTWGPKFRDAMIAMGNINVLTGSAGNIRLNCRKFN